MGWPEDLVQLLAGVSLATFVIGLLWKLVTTGFGWELVELAARSLGLAP